MSLIECTQCGGAVSTRVDKCPICGHATRDSITQNYLASKIGQISDSLRFGKTGTQQCRHCSYVGPMILDNFSKDIRPAIAAGVAYVLTFAALMIVLRLLRPLWLLLPMDQIFESDWSVLLLIVAMLGFSAYVAARVSEAYERKFGKFHWYECPACHDMYQMRERGTSD